MRIALRFDFPDGITVVVGPNGSGKSNIVDAIKWVLGSQSAKSLRGKDMSDVIFKGSQTRQPAGAAEATIIFDNAEGNLPVDAPEVHVTRRVYRSGESEYLINKQAVRLKDVRDLIPGNRYRNRRLQFDRAGQSRSHAAGQRQRIDARSLKRPPGSVASKQRSSRRNDGLARVQSNLTRLSDIVDEVAARLKSVRSQASKAERYRQATERLKELRTVVAWTDWEKMTTESETVAKELAAASEALKQLERQREEMTSQRQAADAELQAIADQAQEFEKERARLAQVSAELKGRREADNDSIADLRPSIAKTLRRARQLRKQAGSAAAQLQESSAFLDQSAQELSEAKEKNATLEERRQAIQQEVDSVLTRRDQVQRQHLEVVRQVATWQSEQQTIRARVNQSKRNLDGLKGRLDAAIEQVDLAEKSVTRAQEKSDSLSTQIRDKSAEVESTLMHSERSRKELAERQEEYASLKTRLEGVRQRHIVLEDLQRRQEGVSGGVRALLSENAGAFSSVVHGMVADFISAEIEIAPMIDAALGARSQYVVVTGTSIHDALVSRFI